MVTFTSNFNCITLLTIHWKKVKRTKHKGVMDNSKDTEASSASKESIVDKNDTEASKLNPDAQTGSGTTDDEAYVLVGEEDQNGVQHTWLVVIIHIILILAENGVTTVELVFQNMGDGGNNRSVLEGKIRRATAGNIEVRFKSLPKTFAKTCQEKYGMTPPQCGQAWVIRFINGHQTRVRGVATNFVSDLRNELMGLFAPVRQVFIPGTGQFLPFS